MSRLTYEKIGFGIMTVMGGLVFGLDLATFGEIKTDCHSKTIRSNLTAILCLSASLITAGVIYFLCIKDSECMRSETDNTASIFFTLGLIVCIGIITSCSLIIAEYKNLDSDQEELCGKHGGRLYVSGILTIACVSFVIFLVGLDFSQFGLVANMIYKSKNNQKNNEISTDGMF